MEVVQINKNFALKVCKTGCIFYCRDNNTKLYIDNNNTAILYVLKIHIYLQIFWSTSTQPK